MASLGHVIVGWAAGRAVSARPQPFGSRLVGTTMLIGLSMLPDADVVMFAFGVPYSDPFGHRGASHSFTFALIIGLLAAFVVRATGKKIWGGPLPALLLVSVVVASHPALDALTDGGLGCALYWPFDATRHFYSWLPIPVAPIGQRFFSGWGLRVALTELLYFSPLLLYALWPQRRRTPALA